MSTFKVNNQITAPQVRLIGEDGKQIGVLPKAEALDYAVGQGKDLVLVGEAANPPVARAVDFKKFLYQIEKKDREGKKNQKASGVKEVRVGSSLAATADVAARIKKTRDFLNEGYTVRVVIKFFGRQLSHPENGHKIINRFREELGDVGKVDREPRIEGKQMITVFSKL